MPLDLVLTQSRTNGKTKYKGKANIWILVVINLSMHGFDSDNFEYNQVYAGTLDADLPENNINCNRKR